LAEIKFFIAVELCCSIRQDGVENCATGLNRFFHRIVSSGNTFQLTKTCRCFVALKRIHSQPLCK